MASDTSYRGSISSGDRGSEFNALSAMVRNLIGRINTATLCRVVGVEPGALGAAGFVDLQPLVNQVDGSDNAVAMPVVYHCPYQRLQAGANAVVIDPEVGDVGFMVCADRDISSVMATRAQSNPGSRRRFDLADAIYLPAWSGVSPLQYVQFTAGGIVVHSPAKVTLEAPEVVIEAETLEVNASTAVTITTPTLTLNGNLNATGTITAPNVVGTTNVTFGGKSGIAHVHGGVDTGTGTSGPPA